MISFSPQERGNEAVTTSFELATSGLTGQRSVQLNYATMFFRWHEETRTPMTFLTGRRPAD
jgi:hypothetical protein